MKSTWLRNLVIDLLYARAFVVAVGVNGRGFHPQRAWQCAAVRYLRWAKAHQRPLPLRIHGAWGYYKALSEEHPQ